MSATVRPPSGPTAPPDGPGGTGPGGARDDHVLAPLRRLAAWSRRSVPLRAALGAGVLSCVVFCLGSLLAGSYPLGPHSRNVVDMGTQYVPFHAYWRQALLGGADGDLLMNWNSGFGSNFLGDIGTYLSSPFDLMVVLFPADHVELALYVITAAKITAAGAAMAVLLLRLRRGPWPVAAVLGSAYALCGWTLDNAVYVPMWLDGLLAFPLLCLVGEWARTGRRPVVGPIVVGLAWVSNFYTAYMATIGAAIVLLIRLLTDDKGRRRLTGVLHAARSVLIGIGLAAPLVLVIYSATKVAHPTPPVTFSPATWPDVFARLLPATSSTESPALYIGTPALALALTMPFNRRLPAPTRFGWPAAICLVALSLHWRPTHLLWHAGAEPNGVTDRQAFVLCGLLLIAAWLSTADGLPRPPALAAGLAVLAALALAARGTYAVDRWSYPVFAVALLLGVLAAAAVLVAPRFGNRARVLSALAVALLVTAQAGETAVAQMRVSELELQHRSWSPRLGRQERDMATAVAAKDDWPRTRTDPGADPGRNDQMVVGGQGAGYYSSLTAQVTYNTLSAVGYGYFAKGRRLVSLDNPVTDAIFAIGTRMRLVQDPVGGAGKVPQATTTAVPPLVTVRPDVRLPDDTARFGPSVFANQEMLLGARVYDPPARTTKTRHGKGSVTVSTTCTPGSRAYLSALTFNGTATMNGGRPVPFAGKLPAVRPPLQSIGVVPASGKVRVELRHTGWLDLPKQPIGCLVTSRLDQAVQHLSATGATGVQVGGHSVTARIPAGSTGTAVVAIPRIKGWTCAAGDGPARPAKNYLGLIAVPLDGTATSVSCDFRPPGLLRGGAIGATALFCLTATAIWYRRSRRRQEALAAPPQV
ncbi:YfhO family protein [Streptomyces sp. NRRL S-813]|uniref:YfhO family protein n=1 Tax=Streptomyces sp. NRRL S-813 TaxID=1463919 RepID=UPI00068F166B|nr:YfhO family protein [Streptomyces sp. NRRL S-813]